jgi:hypothetical protein
LSCLHFYSFLALDNDDFNDLYVNCLFLNLQIPHAVNHFFLIGFSC